MKIKEIMEAFGDGYHGGLDAVKMAGVELLSMGFSNKSGNKTNFVMFTRSEKLGMLKKRKLDKILKKYEDLGNRGSQKETYEYTVKKTPNGMFMHTVTLGKVKR